MRVTISGEVADEDLFFNGGYGYYLPKTTSIMGVCLPKSCDESTVENLKPVLQNMALLNGYLSANISFTFESAHHAELKANKSIYYYVVIYILLVSFVFGVFGTFIEFSQIGNRQDILINGNFSTIKYKDHNKRLLLMKENWALFFLSFSLVRNNLHIFS